MLDGALLEDRLAAKHLPKSHYFTDLVACLVCHDPTQITEIFAEMEAYLARGYYIVAAISYELGYFLEPCLMDFAPTDRTVPLFIINVYQQHERLTSFAVDALMASTSLITPQQMQPFRFSMTQKEYCNAITKILEHIHQGDTYQANYTMKCLFQYCDDPKQLFAWLRQRQTVAYSALIQFDQFTLISLSPELFFQKEQTRLTMRPMKGTCQRGATPSEDEQFRHFLQNDPKNRAENVMIVDLLRNDVSRFAVVGSVQVPHLFQVEAYETLFQMTSTVTAEIAEDLTLHALLKQCFPCGSITGAPKIRTQQIIRAQETAARGFYTGAIGYVLPNRDACFNVPIRTIVLDQLGNAEMGIGSGIVADSIPELEYKETLLKAKFLTGEGYLDKQ